jgi:putative ABC transport system substrate-binding protein
LKLITLTVAAIFAMLWNKIDRSMTQRNQGISRCRQSISVTVQRLGAGEPEDFADAFAAVDREPPDKCWSMVGRPNAR